MRVAVTGSNGLVGRRLVTQLLSAGHEVLGLSRGERRVDGAYTYAAVDLADAGLLAKTLGDFKPDAIINPGGMTDVDGCERDPIAAYEANVSGVASLAKAARSTGAHLVHVSTDYVFDGAKVTPYGVMDQTSPLSAYGRSKAEGERLVRAAHPEGSIIVRSAWLYGTHGSNFVRTISRLYRENGTLTVVDDQRGQPTWTLDLAEQIVQLLGVEYRKGILHFTNTGSTTWFGFAQAIVENLGGDLASVHPTDTAHFPRPAKRPANSVLAFDGEHMSGLPAMRPWRAALDAAMGSGALD